MKTRDAAIALAQQSFDAGQFRETLARRVASLRAGWWGSARTGLKVVLSQRHFDNLGVPKFS